MVTPSRIRQSEPIVRVEASPRYFRSCGWWPIEANGKIRVRGADRRPARQDDVADEFALPAEDHLRTDMAERADPGPVADLGAGLDDGARMDQGLAHSVTSMAPISASATSVPSTRASPRNHHMVRR